MAAPSSTPTITSSSGSHSLYELTTARECARCSPDCAAESVALMKLIGRRAARSETARPIIYATLICASLGGQGTPVARRPRAFCSEHPQHPTESARSLGSWGTMRRMIYRLYGAPGRASAAPEAVLEELGVPYE